MVDTLRSCIIASPGHTFYSLDASQIELRALAHISQDPQMLEDLRSGDLHMGTALRMYGYTDDAEVMKKRRYDAKQGNFATVYGADEFKLSQMFECSIAEAEQFMAEHRAAYPRLYAWMEEQIELAREQGFVINMFGRIRPLPELESPIYRIRSKAEREVVNTLIQGTAVDIVKLAMMTLRDIYPRDVKLVLQVHDEMVWEVPDEKLDWVIERSDILKDIFPDYPFTGKIGKNYGELEDIEGESTDDEPPEILLDSDDEGGE